MVPWAAARVMLRAMPPKTTAWKGRRTTSRRGPAVRAGGTERAGGTVCGRRRPSPRTSPARRGRAAASRPAAAAVLRGDRLDPPEVQGVADPQVLGVAPSATQSDTADEAVHPAPDGPGERERVPAVVAADPLDHPPQRPRRRVDRPLPFVLVEAAARPVRVGGQRVAGRTRHGGGRPAGDDLRLPHPAQGQESASSNGSGRPGASGTYRAMSCSWHTTSWRSDSVSGRAMEAGTGVTRPTQ